jgi:hypothetical protein
MRKKYFLLLAALLTTSLAGCTIRFRTTEPKGENASAVTIGTETTEEKEKSETSEKAEDSANQTSSSASASPSQEAEKKADKHFDSLKYRICRDDQSFDIKLSDGTTATLPCYVDYIEILDESYPYRDEVNKKIREKASLEGEEPFTTESLRSVAKYEDQMSHPASYYLKGEISDSEIYNENGIMSVKSYVNEYSGGNGVFSKNIGYTLDINTGKMLTLPQVLHMENDDEGVKQVVLDAAMSYVDNISDWGINYFLNSETKPADYDFYIREDGMICYSMYTGEFGRANYLGREELPLDIRIDEIESEDDTEEESKDETENVKKEEPAEKVTPQVTATPDEHEYCKDLEGTYGKDIHIMKNEQPVDCGDYYEVKVDILKKPDNFDELSKTGNIPNYEVVDTPYVRIAKDCTVGWVTDPVGEISLEDYAAKWWGGSRDFTATLRLNLHSVKHDANGYIIYFTEGATQY